MRRPSPILLHLPRPNRTPHLHHQHRTFLAPSSAPQILRATRTLPYAPSTLFNVIAAVDTYPTFLPFILSSRVTAHDPLRYPARAALEVGYGGFTETFTSQVRCDPANLVVEAASGEKGGSADEGLFEFLRTKWALQPRGEKSTDVELLIEVRFKSAMYGAMMEAASPGVAGLVVRAFERRVEEVVRSEREEKGG